VIDKVALGEAVHTVMFSHVSHYSSSTDYSLFPEVGVINPFETAVPQVLFPPATKTENQKIKESHPPLLVILKNYTYSLEDTVVFMQNCFIKSAHI
jgi:hypothetical protein